MHLETLVGKPFKPLINRSGLNCRIIVGGPIRVGDRIAWCDPGSLAAEIRRANEAIPLQPAPE